MSHEEKLVSHYRLKTLLRRDGFGKVYLAEDTRTQKDMLLRVIMLNQKMLRTITGRVRSRAQRDHPLIEQIRQRMKRISELKHSHILPVFEFGEEHNPVNNDIIFYMASPFEKESLLFYWSERNSNAEMISLEIVADLVVQAAEALLYVHKHGLIHQYVRLSSFMLRSAARNRKHLHLLLTDFWFADITLGIVEEGQTAQALSVYLAPEQLSQGVTSAASDQYALAVLVYELLLGHRLSRVDLSLKLYETLLSQRAPGATSGELEIARRLDLVLARALAEHPGARFKNIEEFAHTFRAVAHGEEIELADESTFKLPTVARNEGTAIVAGIASAVVAGEILSEQIATQETLTTASSTNANDSTTGMLAVAEIDEEKTLVHGRGLHKTTLTSVGMEKLANSSHTLEEVTLASETSAALPMAEEVSTADSRAADFAAGLLVGETLGAATILAQEAQVATTEQVNSLTTEQTLVLADGASSQAGDIGAQDTLFIPGGASSQIGDIGAQDTLLIPNGASQQGSTITEENTPVVVAGAVGLAAGLLASGAEAETVTQVGEAGALQTGMTGLPASEVATSVAQFGSVGGPELEETHIAAGAPALVATGLATGSVLAAGSTPAAGIVQQNSNGALQAASSPELAESQLAAGAPALATAGFAGSTLTSGTTQQVGMGAIGGTAGNGLIASTPGTPRRSRRRPWLVAALLALIFLCVFAGIFAFALMNNQSSATITLTLQSHTMQSSYIVTAVTTTTTQSQVQARTLTSSITQSKSGQASGFFVGTHASGFITLRNTSTGCGCPLIVPAGTAFTGTSGVTVVTDSVASVASLCTVVVRAHAVPLGPRGAIAAGDIHTTFNSKISVTNASAFAGGLVGHSNSLVQQSDINSLARALQSQVTHNAQANISSQVQSNEHLLGTPICQTKTLSNRVAGSIASSVTVTVSTTCKAEAYDYAGAVQFVQQQVQKQATTYFSDKFVLLGNLKTTVESATLIDARTGKILLVINAAGKWAYQFNNSLKQSLAKVIASKDVNEVRALLASQDGVDTVDIAITGNNQSKLPADDTRITIVLKS
ncbi:MAG TPA: protein kinase [Ktedonobacteraceae bacterium]|nr:protein kinase [Ktedonobacteraceae bacterium]